PALVRAVGDSRVEVSAIAVRALGQVGAPGSDAVLKALTDPRAEVRQAAVVALGRDLGCNRPTGGPPPVRLPDQAPKFSPSLALPALVKMLTDDRSVVRRAAVVSLEAHGPEARSAIPQLLAAVGDDNEARCRVALALLAIGPEAKAAVPFLTDALHGK